MQPALIDRPGIAVLPFINMSGDRAQEYFSDGISEDIITALSKLRWFFVIARNSSFVYKGRSVHINEIARELGVRYVVEGSVRRSGDQVRISAQLNDVTTGSHLWAERYDRSIADVFAVQDEITEAIVAAVEPHLYAAESFRAQHKPPGSLDAWDLVMRALSHYWRVTRQDNTVAQALLEKAIDIDPHYGKALGLLATSRIFGAHMGWAPMGSVMEQRDARGARRGRGRQRGRLGASRARLLLSVCAALRRRHRRVRAGAAPQSEFRVLAGVLCGDAVLFRPLRGRRRRDPPRLAAQPARPAGGDLLRACRLHPVCRRKVRGSHQAGAGVAAAARGFRRRPSRADGGGRHVRRSRALRPSPCRDCARRNRTSRWNGSPANCR